MMRKVLVAILPLCMIAVPLFSLAQTPKDREIEIEIEKSLLHPARMHLDLGIQYYGKGRCDQAIVAYQRVLSDFPGTEYAAEAQFRTANVYHWGTKEPQKALEAYQKVIDNYPDSGFAKKALYWMARTHKKARDYGNARRVWAQIVKSYPDSWEAGQAQKGLYIIDRLGL